MFRRVPQLERTYSNLRSLCKATRSSVTSRNKALSNDVSSMVERKIDVNGMNLNYIKVGNGPHHILLTPGALGSIWTDFKPQITHLNTSEFTIVAWDPPGYGKSCPPKRDFSPGFHYKDAHLGIKLMQKLEIGKYSLLGWDNGGTSSLIMAAKSPDNIIKLVIWGSYSFITEGEVRLLEDFRDHSIIPPRLKDPYIALYGEDYFDELWTRWTDASIAVYNSAAKGDICTSLLPKIACPTLVLHGWKDINIFMNHYLFLCENIKNARFFTFEEGKHNIHLQFWKEFNRIVENFLLDAVPRNT